MIDDSAFLQFRVAKEVLGPNILNERQKQILKDNNSPDKVKVVLDDCLLPKCYNQAKTESRWLKQNIPTFPSSQRTLRRIHKRTLPQEVHDLQKRIIDSNLSQMAEAIVTELWNNKDPANEVWQSFHRKTVKGLRRTHADQADEKGLFHEEDELTEDDSWEM